MPELANLDSSFSFPGLFSVKLAEEKREITDLPNPDSTPYLDRMKWKIRHEEEKFDSDHYLADWMDEEGEIRRLTTKERTGGG